jgi:hypothetical protein
VGDDRLETDGDFVKSNGIKGDSGNGGASKANGEASSIGIELLRVSWFIPSREGAFEPFPLWARSLGPARPDWDP